MQLQAAFLLLVLLYSQSVTAVAQQPASPPLGDLSVCTKQNVWQELCGRQQSPSARTQLIGGAITCTARALGFSNGTATQLSFLENCIYSAADGEQALACKGFAQDVVQHVVALSGSAPGTTAVELDAWEQQLSRSGGLRIPPSAAWAVSPPQLAWLVVRNTAVDLALPAASNRDLSWAGIDMRLRAMTVVGQGVYGVPYDLDIPVMFYRRDALQAAGLAVPQTWDELLMAAQVLNGTQQSCSRPVSGGGSASGDPGCYGRGFCVVLPPGCSNDGALLAAVWASMAALNGATAGLYFTADTMRPRFGGPAFVEAVQMYRELARFGSPAQPACSRFDFDDARQTCAMGIAGSAVARLLGLPPAGPAEEFSGWGNTGTAALPGSSRVENTSAGQMQPCNRELCPFADIHPTKSTGGVSVYVNRAPHPGRGPFFASINHAMDPVTQFATWQAITLSLSPNASWTRVSNPQLLASPIHAEHMQAGAVAAWAAAGWHPRDAADYLAALRYSLRSPNAVPPLRFLGGERVQQLLGWAAAAAVSQDGPAPPDIAKALMANVTAAFPDGFLLLQKSYLESIGVSASGVRAQPWTTVEPPVEAPRGLASKDRIGIGVGIVGVVLLLVSSAIFKRKVMGLGSPAGLRRRRRVGSAQMPGYGAQTTLVVTDIQDSTVLWETLPASIMDLALNLHNDCVRRIVRTYHGYETHTEGDSFTLAFHSAVEATSFALQLQVDLMELNWPEQVLEHSSAAEVFLTSKAAAAAAAVAAAAATSGPTAPASRPISDASPRITPSSAHLYAAIGNDGVPVQSGSGPALAAGLGRLPSSSLTCVPTPSRAASRSVLGHVTSSVMERSTNGSGHIPAAVGAEAGASEGVAIAAHRSGSARQRSRGRLLRGEAPTQALPADASDSGGAGTRGSYVGSGALRSGSATARAAAPATARRLPREARSFGVSTSTAPAAGSPKLNFAHRVASSRNVVGVNGGDGAALQDSEHGGVLPLVVSRSMSMSPATQLSVLGRRPSMPSMQRHAPGSGHAQAPSPHGHPACSSPPTLVQRGASVGAFRRRSALGGASGPGGGRLTSPSAAPDWLVSGSVTGGGDTVLPSGNSLLGMPSRSVSRFALAHGVTKSASRNWAAQAPGAFSAGDTEPQVGMNGGGRVLGPVLAPLLAPGRSGGSALRRRPSRSLDGRSLLLPPAARGSGGGSLTSGSSIVVVASVARAALAARIGVRDESECDSPSIHGGRAAEALLTSGANVVLASEDGSLPIPEVEVADLQGGSSSGNEGTRPSFGGGLVDTLHSGRRTNGTATSRGSGPPSPRTAAKETASAMPFSTVPTAAVVASARRSLEAGTGEERQGASISLAMPTVPPRSLLRRSRALSLDGTRSNSASATGSLIALGPASVATNATNATNPTNAVGSPQKTPAAHPAASINGNAGLVSTLTSGRSPLRRNGVGSISLRRRTDSTGASAGDAAARERLSPPSPILSVAAGTLVPGVASTTRLNAAASNGLLRNGTAGRLFGRIALTDEAPQMATAGGLATDPPGPPLSPVSPVPTSFSIELFQQHNASSGGAGGNAGATHAQHGGLQDSLRSMSRRFSDSIGYARLALTGGGAAGGAGPAASRGAGATASGGTAGGMHAGGSDFPGICEGEEAADNSDTAGQSQSGLASVGSAPTSKVTERVSNQRFSRRVFWKSSTKVARSFATALLYETLRAASSNALGARVAVAHQSLQRQQTDLPQYGAQPEAPSSHAAHGYGSAPIHWSSRAATVASGFLTSFAVNGSPASRPDSPALGSGPDTNPATNRSTTASAFSAANGAPHGPSRHTVGEQAPELDRDPATPSHARGSGNGAVAQTLGQQGDVANARVGTRQGLRALSWYRLDAGAPGKAAMLRIQASQGSFKSEPSPLRQSPTHPREQSLGNRPQAAPSQSHRNLLTAAPKAPGPPDGNSSPSGQLLGASRRQLGLPVHVHAPPWASSHTSSRRRQFPTPDELAPREGQEQEEGLQLQHPLPRSTGIASPMRMAAREGSAHRDPVGAGAGSEPAGCGGMLSGAASALTASSGCGRVATGMLARLTVGSRRRIASHTSAASRAAGADSVLLFRGFRVRVGIHSGLDEGCDVFWTKRSGRRAYSGPAMRQARLLSDAALGGMVVLSDSTLDLLRPLPNERLPAGALVWHSGRFRLGDREGYADVDVYQALLPALLPRLQAFHGMPLRVVAALMPGLTEAPVGPVAVATCQVVGVDVLRAWDYAVTEAALEMFRWQAAEVVSEHGGTVVGLDGGTVVAAFTKAYPALVCLLTLEAALKSEVPWPAPLLEHELGEEFCCLLPPGPDGVVVTQLVHFGPRVRCAVEWFSDVRLDPGVTRAVQLYRNASSGKPWKNMQRMLRQAKMGQTLISGSLQRQLAVSGGPLLDHIHIEPLNPSAAATATGAVGGAALMQDGPEPPHNPHLASPRAHRPGRQRSTDLSAHGSSALFGATFLGFLSMRGGNAGHAQQGPANAAAGGLAGRSKRASGPGAFKRMHSGASESGAQGAEDGTAAGAAAATAASAMPLDRLAREEPEGWGQPPRTPSLQPAPSHGSASARAVARLRDNRSLGSGPGSGAASAHGGTSTSAANSSNPSECSDYDQWPHRARNAASQAGQVDAHGAAGLSRRMSHAGLGAGTASRSRLAAQSRDPSMRLVLVPEATEAVIAEASASQHRSQAAAADPGSEVPTSAYGEVTAAMPRVSAVLPSLEVDSGTGTVDARSSAGMGGDSSTYLSSLLLNKLAASQPPPTLGSWRTQAGGATLRASGAGILGTSAGTSGGAGGGVSGGMAALPGGSLMFTRDTDLDASTFRTSDPRASLGTAHGSMPLSQRASTCDVSSRLNSVLVPPDRSPFSTAYHDPHLSAGLGVVVGSMERGSGANGMGVSPYQLQLAHERAAHAAAAAAAAAPYGFGAAGAPAAGRYLPPRPSRSSMPQSPTLEVAQGPSSGSGSPMAGLSPPGYHANRRASTGYSRSHLGPASASLNAGAQGHAAAPASPFTSLQPPGPASPWHSPTLSPSHQQQLQQQLRAQPSWFHRRRSQANIASSPAATAAVALPPHQHSEPLAVSRLQLSSGQNQSHTSTEAVEPATQGLQSSAAAQPLHVAGKQQEPQPRPTTQTDRAAKSAAEEGAAGPSVPQRAPQPPSYPGPPSPHPAGAGPARRSDATALEIAPAQRSAPLSSLQLPKQPHQQSFRGYQQPPLAASAHVHLNPPAWSPSSRPGAGTRQAHNRLQTGGEVGAGSGGLLPKQPPAAATHTGPSAAAAQDGGGRRGASPDAAQQMLWRRAPPAVQARRHGQGGPPMIGHYRLPPPPWASGQSSYSGRLRVGAGSEPGAAPSQGQSSSRPAQPHQVVPVRQADSRPVARQPGAPRWAGTAPVSGPAGTSVPPAVNTAAAVVALTHGPGFAARTRGRSVSASPFLDPPAPPQLASRAVEGEAPNAAAKEAGAVWAGSERQSRATLRGLLTLGDGMGASGAAPGGTRLERSPRISLSSRLLSSDLGGDRERGAVYVCRWKGTLGPWKEVS